MTHTLKHTLLYVHVGILQDYKNLETHRNAQLPRKYQEASQLVTISWVEMGAASSMEIRWNKYAEWWYGVS